MNSPNNPFGDVSCLQNEITYGQNYRTIILSQQKPIKKTRQIRTKVAIRKKPWRYGKGFLCRTKKNATLTLLERNALTQDEYMRILAIPRKLQKGRRRTACTQRIRKRIKLTTYRTCPPHIKQLALPKKRYVLETWKQFQDLLAPEVLVRFNEILHYESHRLDLNEASYYFKQLNLQKRKKRRRKHKKRRKIPKWLRREVRELAKIICNLIKHETLYELDLKQYLLSEALLDFLVEKRVIKSKPKRNTKNFCLQSIMEVCNKLAMWFDEFGESAGFKPSLLEDLVIITSQLSLVEEEGEGGEGEEEEEEEEEGEEEEEEEESEEEGLDNLFIRELEQSRSESELEFDYEQEGFDLFSHLSEDSLGRLIRILANSSDEYLDSYLDSRLWPNARNRDVLEKLIELRNGLLNLEGTRTNRLEELMTLWAKRNQPDQVDDRIQNKIQVTSRIIAELLGLYEKEDKDVQPSPSFLAAYEGGRRMRRPGESSSESGESSISLGLYPDQDVGDIDDLLSGIRGHKPPKTYPHSPDKICCLSLKIWAIWLMNVTQNLHKWTKWIIGIIKKIREYAAIVRDPTKKLYKQEWRNFCKETDDQIVTWRQYSKHVRELSDEIIENFHGKPVICCPACLYNHKIPNVVQAHETIQALVEAINCAAYWHRCLDRMVDEAGSISDIDVTEGKSGEGTESSSSTTESIEIIETVIQPSEESVYVIEEIPTRN